MKEFPAILATAALSAGPLCKSVLRGLGVYERARQSPERCPKCGATVGLVVAVTVVPDGSTIFGGRVVWDNDTATECTACGFIGKVADFEPKDSYGPENEEEMEKKAAAMYGFDIEGERRREAGFKDEIRRRWEAGKKMKSAKKEDIANGEPVWSSGNCFSTPSFPTMTAPSSRRRISHCSPLLIKSFFLDSAANNSLGHSVKTQRSALAHKLKFKVWIC
jgi:hypothetical protein